MWIYLHSDRFPQNTNRHNRLEVVSVGPNQSHTLVREKQKPPKFLDCRKLGKRKRGRDA